MFIKKTRSKNYTYLQLVQSYRQGKKTKHKVIASFGRLDQLQGNKQFIDAISKLVTIVSAEHKLVKLDGLKELTRQCWGYKAYKSLFKSLGIEPILESLLKKSQIQYNIIDIVLLLVIDRLLQPASKLSSYQNKDRYVLMDFDCDLHHVYRSLDVLSGWKQEIEDRLFSKDRNLFNSSIDLVFYDVTTFHFESVRADEFRDFGFSKACKFNEVQIVMGLMIDQQGIPIGYSLYPGNTFEGKTLIKTLEKLKKRFSINKVIMVADKGLNSKINLKEIRAAGYDYIVAARIKQLPKKIQEQILEEKGYIEDKAISKEEDSIKSKVIDYNYKLRIKQEDGKVEKYEFEDQLICTWSKKRASKDKKDRERMVEKAEKVIEEGNAVYNKNGAKRYLQIESSQKPSGLDEAKILSDEKYDGYYAIQSSNRNMKRQDVIKAYHSLWKIEESFRILKSTMKTRPIFHWTKKRIEGHFVICFISFLLERTLELKLKEKSIDCSVEKIKEALNGCEVSKLELSGEEFYLKSQTPPLANKIFRTLRERQVKNMVSVSDFVL